MLTLGNGEPTADFDLKTFGFLTGECDTYNVPLDTYISTVTLQYTDHFKGLSYIGSNGDFRKYGTHSSDFQTTKWSFDEDFEWLGLYGTFTNVPHSFGVISFKKVCAPKPIVYEPTPEPLFFTPIEFIAPEEIAPIAIVVVPEELRAREDLLCSSPIGFAVAASVVILLRFGILFYAIIFTKDEKNKVIQIDFETVETKVKEGETLEAQNKIQG